MDANDSQENAFLPIDHGGDRLPVRGRPRRHVLQDLDGERSSENLLRHQNADRIANQARVRERTTGAIIAQRDSRLHRGGGES